MLCLEYKTISRGSDLNRQHLPYEGSALPIELPRQKFVWNNSTGSWLTVESVPSLPSHILNNVFRKHRSNPSLTPNSQEFQGIRHTSSGRIAGFVAISTSSPAIPLHYHTLCWAQCFTKQVLYQLSYPGVKRCLLNNLPPFCNLSSNITTTVNHSGNVDTILF